MADFRESIFSLRKGKFDIQMVDGGSGPDLLYLHGEQGFSGWAPFLDSLAETFHVYAPAHPGVAESVGLEELDDLWDLVLFYEELMTALGIEGAAVIGHSYGGMVAAELAAHRKGLVSQMALVSSLGLWLDQSPTLDFFTLTPSEEARAFWFDPECQAAKSTFVMPDDPEARQEAMIERAKTLSSIGKFIWPIPDRGLPKRAHRIEAPTLLVWGDSDAVVPPEYAEAFRTLIPGAELDIIDNCGHLPQYERPERFVISVASFLSR